MLSKRKESLKGKIVAITGGAGFVGSHLTHRLLEEGAEVHLIVRESTSLWRLSSFKDSLSLHISDVSSSSDMNRTIQKINPSYFFHLSAYGVDASKKDYITATKINVLAIANIFSALKYIDCKKVILLGSSSEYGEVDHRITEDTPLKPVNIYGSTKACGTILAHQLGSENNIPVITFRPFGLFGEGEEPHKLFAYVILQSLKEKDINLTKGEQYRDYLYVENLIDALILACEDSTLRNEIFNIGSGVSKPLRYYSDLIISLTETTSKVNYGAIAYRKNEIWNPSPDINKIRARLHWNPKIPLEKGLVNTINWFKENLFNYNDIL